MQQLDAIGDPELRLTLLFARAQRRPVTADAVAVAHGVHRNVARARLERLAQAGLLIPAFERQTGRTGPGAGRPAKTYRVAPELAAIEFPPRHFERLLSLVADALPQERRLHRLHEIGVAFGNELARKARPRRVRTLERALDHVCSALGRLGYQASVADVDGLKAVITTPTCPLRPLVRADWRLAELDRGMWSGLLGAAFAPARSIACETVGCRSNVAACRVRLLVD